MTLLLSNDFETDTAGLTLVTSGSATLSRGADAAITGGYGLAAQADSSERAMATADDAAAIAGSGRYAAGCLLRASSASEEVLIMQSECFRLWLLAAGTVRLDILSGRELDTIALTSITSGAAVIAARRTARVVVEIVRDSADGDDDGEARLWLDGEQIGELTGLDLWETAASITTAMGADRSYADYHFEFNAAYANRQQVMNLGSETEDVTITRDAVTFDGIGDYAPLGFLPTDSTTVTMTFIPAAGQAGVVFFGNDSLSLSSVSDSILELSYRGGTANGAYSAGSAQVWLVVSAGTTATLYINGVQCCQITGASDAFVTDLPFIGAFGDGATGLAFAEMALLELTYDNGTTDLHYTCKAATVDATDILDQSGNGHDSTVVGADLDGRVNSTHDVCLGDGYLCDAATVIKDDLGDPVNTLPTGDSATIFLDFQIPTGSTAGLNRVLNGSSGNAFSVNAWCGIASIGNSELRIYVAKDDGSAEVVYVEAHGTARKLVAVVYDREVGNVRIYINGALVATVTPSGVANWPYINTSSGNFGVGTALAFQGAPTPDSGLKVYGSQILNRALSDAEAIALTGGAV